MIPIALHEKAIQNTFYKIQREGVKNLAITSAKRHEGVSAVSYALARRAATAGLKVLLIDFNLAHPDQTKHLALERVAWSPVSGLNDNTITKLSNTNLSILSAPPHVKDTWPFQDQEKIQLMLKHLGQRYDLIIADMPSILEPESDLQTEIACSAFEGVFIVTLASKTLETEMTQIKKILNEAYVNILGSIMNDQFTPTLTEELIRQLEKLRSPFKPVAASLKKWISHSAFLSQSL